jgi:hypothetical protein
MINIPPVNVRSPINIHLEGATVEPSTSGVARPSGSPASQSSKSEFGGQSLTSSIRSKSPTPDDLSFLKELEQEDEGGHIEMGWINDTGDVEGIVRQLMVETTEHARTSAISLTLPKYPVHPARDAATASVTTTNKPSTSASSKPTHQNNALTSCTKSTIANEICNVMKQSHHLLPHEADLLSLSDRVLEQLAHELPRHIDNGMSRNGLTRLFERYGVHVQNIGGALSRQPGEDYFK